MRHVVTGSWSVRLVLVLALLGVLSLPLASAAPVRAAITLTVSPAMVELEAEPSAEGSQPITIENGGDEAVEIAAAVEPYKGATGDRSAVEWLRAEPERFTLEPGESRMIDVTIAVPKGLSSGGRYALVSFATGAGSAVGNGAAIAGKIGVAFLVVVDGKGKLTREVGLDRFAPVLEPDGRVGFRVLLHNAGNVHARPVGAVAISDAEGKPFASLELPPAMTLLPDGETLLSAQGSLPLDPESRYRAEAIVDYGAREPVTATVEFSPQAALTVAALRVCENLDRGPTLTVGLRNEGELGLLPHVTLAVRQATGPPLGTARPPEPMLLWPGEEGETAVDFPDRLVSGEYVLAVEIHSAAPDPEGRSALPPIAQELSFRIGGLDADAAALCGG